MPGKPYCNLKELKMPKEKIENEKEKLERYLEMRESTEIREIIEDLRNYIEKKDQQIKEFVFNNPCQKEYYNYDRK